MKSDFIIALTQLAAERNLPREIVLSAIEAALVSAYKRDSVASGQDISVTLNPGSGDIEVHTIKTAVTEVVNPEQELSIEDARKLSKNAQVGDTVRTGMLPQTSGRIAAQTAKQVVLQRLRDAERDLVFSEYADKEGEAYTVTVQRIEHNHIVVELGRAEAILPPSEQLRFDRYRVGQKMKMLLQSIRQSAKGPELIVSRADKLLVKRLFEMEVPEIYNGTVEIISIAREPGSRNKVAVSAKQEGIDAVGSCVGLRGVRIQNIVNELHGEKIDVVQWDKNPAQLIASALSPCQVLRVDIDDRNHSSVAVVPERQLSLAIGKDGQNARLAAKLTGWKVDIRSDVEDKTAPKPSAPPVPIYEKLGFAGLMDDIEDAPIDSLDIASRSLKILKSSGFETLGQLLRQGEEELLALKSFGQKSLEGLIEQLTQLDLQQKSPVVDEAVSSDTEDATPDEGVIQDIPAEATEILESTETQPEEELQKEPIIDESESKEEIPETVAPAVPEKTLVEPVVEPTSATNDDSTSIQDLPDDVWSIGRNAGGAGAIRFSEDIAELNNIGAASRSGRGSRKGGQQSNRNRRTRSNKKR